MREQFHRVIAIDGPAASGKSSVARELSRQLGFVYVNSGAIYRAITWYILQKRIDPEDGECITEVLKSAPITGALQDNELRVVIDGVDPADHLRDDCVNEKVAGVSQFPEVRQVVAEKLHKDAYSHNLIVEGRDIGSVVFPDTPYNFTLMLRLRCASSVARHKEGGTKSRSAIARILRARFLRSSSRKTHASSILRFLQLTK
jgi:cytidylate kinase